MELHISLTGRKDLAGEIYRQLRRAIGEGRLRPGDPLPPSRELALRLSVSRTTVTVAYDRLVGEGFVTSRVGAGTFVGEHGSPSPRTVRSERPPGALQPRPLWDSIPLLPAPARPAPFDFRTGVPDATLFPHDRWRRRMARQLAEDAASAGVYGEPAGHRGLRTEIARHLGVARAVVTTAEDVTIINGTQQALDVLARALLAPGDRVAVEDPGYRPVRYLLQSLGLEVCGVPVDAEGLVVEALPSDVRLVFVTPSHQYPLGLAMSLPRRRALLAWADRHDAAILEDDYDSEFRFGGRPIEPLQTLDTSGRVVYVGTFSKTLLPSLRLGFLVTPSSLRVAVHKAKQVTDWHSSTPVQGALARFLADGELTRHVRRMNGAYRVRHELLTATLARDFSAWLEVVPSAAGLHVAAFARDREAGEIATVVRRASEDGVEVRDLSAMTLNAPGRPGLLLGYGAIPTDRIEEGLWRLRRCFESSARGIEIPRYNDRP